MKKKQPDLHLTLRTSTWYLDDVIEVSEILKSTLEPQSFNIEIGNLVFESANDLAEILIKNRVSI